MKKFVFSLFLVLATTIACAQTSVYHPFPEANAFWSEHVSGVPFEICDKDQYILTGDTAINGVTYQKLRYYVKRYYLHQNLCLYYGSYRIYDFYKGAIRNDIAGKRIWFMEANHSNEKVLYDFDLNLNDILPPSFINDPNFSPGTYNIVKSVDSVLVGAVYHSRYGLAISNHPGNIYVYLIEGVGSTFGLFGSFGLLNPEFEIHSYLECLSVSGQAVYPDASVSCPSIITEVVNIEKDEIFSIFPNPMQEFASIRLPANVNQADLTIYDFSGKRVAFYKSIRDNQILNRVGLPNGIYICHFEFGNGKFVSSKLIIN